MSLFPWKCLLNLRCANITVELDKLVTWYNALTTYKEVDTLYIVFKTGHLDMVGDVAGGCCITIHGNVTDFVANVLWNKIGERIQTKKGQNTVVHTLT